MAVSVEDPAAAVPPPPAPEDGVASLANTEIFLTYLRKTVAVVLGLGSSSAGVGVFEDRTSLEAARKFISDSQTRVILVQKIPRKGIHIAVAVCASGLILLVFVFFQKIMHRKMLRECLTATTLWTASSRFPQRLHTRRRIPAGKWKIRCSNFLYWAQLLFNGFIWRK